MYDCLHSEVSVVLRHEALLCSSRFFAPSHVHACIERGAPERPLLKRRQERIKGMVATLECGATLGLLVSSSHMRACMHGDGGGYIILSEYIIL